MKKIMLLIMVCIAVFYFTGIGFPQHQHGGQKTTEVAGQQQRKIKYWICGMHPQVREDKPGLCPICNMKLTPVYEEALGTSLPLEAGVIKLSQRDIALAGVASEKASFRRIFKEIRTVGRIAYDPDLYKTEEEFIQALRTEEKLRESQIPELKERTEALVEAAKLKLRLSGLGEEQIEGLSKKKEADRSLIISDEENPYVWVYADVYESELSWIKVNQPVKVVSVSFPGEEFMGKIEAVDPVLNPMTRSLRIRVRIENPELKLKPEMYVDVFIESFFSDKNNQHSDVLAVPDAAVLDTGMRKIVYLDLGDGAYSARVVKVGPKGFAYVNGEKKKFFPVASGLAENDLVVTKANFLIDSQSQITGVAASVYGGALGAEENPRATTHQH